MSEHETIAGLIPWFLNGTLSPEDRRRVEDHLLSCEECRALLEEARAMELAGREDQAELLDHVQAQHLESYAVAPGSVPPDLAGWIRQHLDGCDVCRDAHRILERSVSGRSAIDGARERPAGESASIWSLLTRTVFHPVAAAAYLLILAVVVPVYRGVVHLPDVERRVGAVERELEQAKRWGGAVDLPVLSSALRGENDVATLVSEEGQPVLPIGAEFELPGDLDRSKPLRFTVRSDTVEIVWSREIPVPQVLRNLDDAGIVTLLLPAAAVSPGRYRLTVDRIDRPASRPILDASFRIERHRQSPAATKAPQ
jgi:hypothetical protein